jgi:soluble lytic murein transglycosylase-like protein
MLLSATATAADLAVLRNGYTIRHESREEIGALTRLYISADRASFVDVPSKDVEYFEKDDSPAPVAASPIPGKTAQRSPIPSIVPSAKASPEEIADAIGSASNRYKIDPDFVSSVISAESGYNSRAVSPKGAQGLMQLMPGTASQLGVDNAFDAAKNTDGGTRYLRGLLERYHYDVPKALAAYNAGATRVDQHNGVPPYLETRKYVARIINDYNRKKLAQEKLAKSQASASSKKTTATAAKARPKNPPAAQSRTKSGTVYQAETFHQQ